MKYERHSCVFFGSVPWYGGMRSYITSLLPFSVASMVLLYPATCMISEITHNTIKQLLEIGKKKKPQSSHSGG